MSIELHSNVVRAAGMMTAPVDQDIVILNMSKNNYVSLDQVGRRIWELLEAPVTVAVLCERLAVEFEGSKEQITADVIQFLDELEREGLVSVTDR